MGAYYTAFNHDKRELLDPDNCDGNSKQTSVVCGEFANLLAFAMSERWMGDNVCLLTDEGSNYDAGGRLYWHKWHAEYKDVSLEELAKFRSRYSEQKWSGA
jgi:hypothetical protein